MLASADYPEARDEALAVWRELFDGWLVEGGHEPGRATFTEIVVALGLSDDRWSGGGTVRPDPSVRLWSGTRVAFVFGCQG